MNEDTSRKDIRRLLKQFGIRADETLVAHLARNPDVESLHVRIVLEDLTVYDEEPDGGPAALSIDGVIRRTSEE